VQSLRVQRASELLDLPPGMASLNCCAIRFLGFLPGEGGAPGRCLRHSALAHHTLATARAARDEARAATTNIRTVVTELSSVGNEAICRYHAANRAAFPGLRLPDGVDCEHATGVHSRLQAAVAAPVTPPADPPPAPSPAPAAPPPPAP
jgi:hypothetical protein